MNTSNNKFSLVHVLVLRYSILWGSCLTLLQVGCKKFVTVAAPATAIASSAVYSSDLSASSAMTSIYDNMMSNTLMSSGYQSISCLAGLTADEFKNYSTSAPWVQCYSNSLNSSVVPFWSELYRQIHVANAVLEGISQSTGVSTQEKQQLTGEAKFMRAFFHFYGTNLFGAIPIVTTTNYETNNSIQRSAQSDVYQQIIADLKEAQSLLPENFVTPTGGTITAARVRPNKWAATALLARTYLYNGSWDSAEAAANLVINNTALFSSNISLDSIFLANSKEAIWQLQPVLAGYNTFDAYFFVLTSTPGGATFPVALSTNLVSTFENSDQRIVHWVRKFNASNGQTYYYPFKYKVNTVNANQPVTEYQMVFRLAEQYLIRAEARAQKGNLQGAVADLNIIRARAGLSGTTATTQGDLLNAIYHERQIELFTEWGHRWFDLIRTKNINSVMGSPGNVCQSKGGSWSTNWSLFPIPSSEITINPNLTQNPGYN